MLRLALLSSPVQLHVQRALCHEAQSGASCLGLWQCSWHCVHSMNMLWAAPGSHACLASGTAFTGKQLRTFKKRLKTDPGLHKILRSLRIGVISQTKICYCFTTLGERAGVVVGLNRDCPLHQVFGARCYQSLGTTPQASITHTALDRGGEVPPMHLQHELVQRCGRGPWGSGLAAAWLH